MENLTKINIKMKVLSTQTFKTALAKSDTP